jgi:hypothetical protein
MVVKNKNYVLNNPLKESNIAILVTSYAGHLMFLMYALSRYMETGKYVICSYDSFGKADIPSNIWKIPHSWVFKHMTHGAGKRNGWLWDILYAAGTIILFDDIEYIFTVNSDCIWDKPENVDAIINLLGNADLMSASSNGTIHTCNVVWKRRCFLDFVSYIKNKLWNNRPESYSPEVLLRDFILENKYVNKTAPIQPIFPKNHFYEGRVDHYSSYNQDCTWKNILGYRNLGAEHKASCLEHLEPVPKKYIDIRNKGQFFSQHERNTLYFYYVGGDRRYLYKYWAEGEDSYWNRRYYPIEYYGQKILSDDSQRKQLGPPSERLGHFDRWKYNSFILKDDEYDSKWKAVIDR